MGDDEEGDGPEPDDGPRRGSQDASGEDETVSRVELALRELSVTVTGRSEDDLETVEESARDLMGYLVAETEALEGGHDEYGLS
ncbi:MAG: hypothetical protein ACOCQU_03490 [Halolamina sp.]